MADTVSAEVYLQIAPEFGTYRDHATGRRAVWGARLRKATQKRPERPDPNTVLVHLTVQVPKAAFHPLEPTAIVVIPEDLVQTSVEVIAEAV